MDKQLRVSLAQAGCRKTKHSQPRARRAGQAIVEFAFISSLLLLLLAAAVDLGNAYRAYQLLMNATAEASSYLTIKPLANCAIQDCPGNDSVQGADREARLRFRQEQSSALGTSVSTLDLDGSGDDDLAEHGWAWIEGRVRIIEADDNQVTNDYQAIGHDFGGTSNSDCQNRKKLDQDDGHCYVVVQAEMEYRPLVLQFIVGESMTIRASSVRQIVEGL